MRHRNRWSGRARDASARLDFESALYGTDPAERKPFDPRQDRKTRQLCRQVQRALILALAGECDDEVLRELFVDGVEPLGNASHLVVRVGIPSGVRETASEVVRRLNAAAPRLRLTVAASISRKRVPCLAFVAVPVGQTPLEGGER